MQEGRATTHFHVALGPRYSKLSTYKKSFSDTISKQNLRHYFLGYTLIIRSDQQILKYITNQRIPEGIQHKLMLKLLEFNFIVECKKDNENIADDALSRKFSSLFATSHSNLDL
jgi:hypothetical protein